MEYHPETILALHSVDLDHLIIDKGDNYILAAFHDVADAYKYIEDFAPWTGPPSMTRAEIVETGLASSPSDPWKGLTVKEEGD